VIMIHQRYRQTDRQTDDMRSQDRALHYSASRGNKRNLFWEWCRVFCAWPGRSVIWEGDVVASSPTERRPTVCQRCRGAVRMCDAAVRRHDTVVSLQTVATGAWTRQVRPSVATSAKSGSRRVPSCRQRASNTG